MIVWPGEAGHEPGRGTARSLTIEMDWFGWVLHGSAFRARWGVAMYVFYANPWSVQPVKVESDSLDWIRAVYDALKRAGMENLSARP